MLKQKIQNRVMNSSPYQLIVKKQQEKVSNIYLDKLESSPFDFEALTQEIIKTCPTETNNLETDPPSPINNCSEHNTTINDYIKMLGTIEGRPSDDFVPFKPESPVETHQFLRETPEVKKAIYEEPLEIEPIESAIPNTKLSVSEIKLDASDVHNVSEANNSTQRNRRPLSMTSSKQLVKSPSGRNERIDAAKDKIASKVSMSKGSFSSSNQKSSTSTTASRTSKNGLDKVTISSSSNLKPGTPFGSKTKLSDSPSKLQPRLQYKAPELLASTECIRSPKVNKHSSSGSKQVASPYGMDQKYGIITNSKSKIERTRQDSTPSMLNSVSNVANNTAVYTLKQSSSCVSPSRNVEVLVTPRGNKKIFEVFKNMDIKIELGTSDKQAGRDRIIGKHKKSNSKPEFPKPKQNKQVSTKLNLYDDVVVEEIDPSEAYLTEIELIFESLKEKIKENRIEIFEDEKMRAGLMHLKSLASINLAALRDFKA